MTDSNKLSFYSILLLIFLLPLFFLPAAILPIGLAKSALLLVVLLVSVVSIALSMLRGGRLSLPRTKLLWAALVLPVVYLLSGATSITPSLSLFGYGFEIGTAASIVLLAGLFLVSAVAFRDRARLVRGYSAIFVSFALLALFVLVKIVSGGSWLTLGTFSGIMANPAGSWMDLAGAFAALLVLSAFALEMLPLGRLMSLVTWAVFALSLALVALIGFSTVWAMLLGAGLVLLVYFLTVEKSAPAEDGSAKHSSQGIWAAAILSLVALMFVWNPVFSERSLSQSVSAAAGINNVDVRPSLSATLGVAKSVIAAHPVLGSGPATFDKEWLLYKSPAVNSSMFWNTPFNFGFGFLPTAFATTGLLGIAAWAIFLGLFISLGVKILSRSPERRADRFIVMSAYLIALFLWLGAFLFVPSIVLLALAFVFTGLAVGAAESTGVIGTLDLNLHQTRLSSFASGLVLLVVFASMLVLGFVGTKKVLASWHFGRAVALSASEKQPVDAIASEIASASRIAPSDQYWAAISQVELARANAALKNASSTDEERQKVFQDSLSKSIAALNSAISLNPTYANWIALGNLFESLVPAPLSISGAHDSALAAYQSAKALHPTSPEIPLLLARLEFDNKDIEGARKHIDEALALKADYADAYFFLAQLEISQNNLAKAIPAAETGVLLTPNNAGVLFELGLLKYSNKDYAGAADAFGRALAIAPDYANAKYYLALSLDGLGEKDKALALFEDLAKTNPENEAVLKAIANLKAGRPALEDTSASPAKKAKTPPITGQ